MSNFEKPHNPLYYVLFEESSREFKGKFCKLIDLRNFCEESNLEPEDVFIYRAFYPDTDKRDRKLMEITEYAYPNTTIESIGGIYCEVKAWGWREQEPYESGEKIEHFKNKIFIFLNKMAQYFSFLK